MLTFFRRIRKTLIDSGRLSRYLIYAIGEILLVVIGILIALQINNWNENRKNSITEKKILWEVAENLEANLGRLQNLIDRCITDNQSTDIIVQALNHNLPNMDTLEGHFALALNTTDAGSFLSYVGYESLKNTGFEIIRNDRLKKEIINLFEGTYKELQSKYHRLDKMNGGVIDYRHTNFLRSGPGFRIIPVNYNQLREDHQIYDWPNTLKGSRTWLTESLRTSLDESRRVLSLLKEDL